MCLDEVESLTAARSGAANGTEPSDALRVGRSSGQRDMYVLIAADLQVVNALLTQLDKLKTRRNVLVMTTSNIAGAIGWSFDPCVPFGPLVKLCLSWHLRDTTPAPY
jgi:SpoVK/Ycf46/Vps4 family AAA+-type ATPase